MWNTNTDNKKAGETRTIFVSFADKLFNDEFLTGTPTAAELGSADLTITDVSLSTTDCMLGNRTIPAYSAVTFSVSGGIARTDYTIRITTGSDTSPIQTLVIDYRLSVQ